MLHSPPVDSSLSADAPQAKDAYLALVNPTHRSHITNLYLDAASGEAERDKWRAILVTLARPEAFYFAAYARLPESDQRRMKATRQAAYLESHMQNQPATNSQLGLLHRLGWTGRPTINTRAEAAALISALLDNKGARRGNR